MPFWRLYYHHVWATKGRKLLIDEANERLIARSIRTTCTDQRAILHALGAMPDHVHVAVSIPPSIAVASFVGRLKGASAHAVNDAQGRADGSRFAWQAEYGAFSFTEKSLAEIVAYVENQRERHAARQLWHTLERIDAPNQPASAGLSGPARGL